MTFASGTVSLGKCHFPAGWRENGNRGEKGPASWREEIHPGGKFPASWRENSNARGKSRQHQV
jgi:hypothetical protein